MQFSTEAIFIICFSSILLHINPFLINYFATCMYLSGILKYLSKCIHRFENQFLFYTIFIHQSWNVIISICYRYQMLLVTMDFIACGLIIRMTELLLMLSYITSFSTLIFKYFKLKYTHKLRLSIKIFLQGICKESVDSSKVFGGFMSNI